MPSDDGSEVKIDNQVVFRGFDGVWKHFIRVCNRTNAPKDVWVTTWPYDDKMRKIGQKTGQRIAVLPANTCQWISIEIGGQPTQYYTDVYEYNDWWPGNEGRRYHYVIDSARVVDIYPIYRDFLMPRGIRVTSVGCVLPYPRSLETGGASRNFYVRNVRGLPPGWKVRNIWPAKGETFALTPDQKEFRCQLELECGKRMPSRAVTTVTVEAGIRGKPFRPPWVLRVAIPFVRTDHAPQIAALRIRRRPERSCLEIVARITDASGLIEAPEFVYSADHGRTWKSVILKVQEIHRSNALGAADATFEGMVTLPAPHAAVWTKIHAPDRLGNIAESPMKLLRDKKRRFSRPSRAKR